MVETGEAWGGSETEAESEAAARAEVGGAVAREEAAREEAANESIHTLHLLSCKLTTRS